MRVLEFAAAMEASIRQEIEQLTAAAPPELQPVADAVAACQAEFELLIDKIRTVDDRESYPAIEAQTLLGDEEKWRKVTAGFAACKNKTTGNLVSLWCMYGLVDRACQFYRQAAANSAHPSARLFFSSLAEVKGMLRRRIDAPLRVMHNEVWERVGFAPSIAGKD